MCIIWFGLPLSGEATPTEWLSSLIVNGCGFFEYPTSCSDPFVGLLNGQTDGQLASSICDNAVIILSVTEELLQYFHLCLVLTDQ